jgi:LytS/YehU family sensor histidine kinase
MLIWFAIKAYIKKVKKETEIKQTIMDLERRAVQAQMNPHFIFNALTSIQSLIVQNKNDKAQQFLVTFSRLVRTALNHSSLTYVPLSQELELIKNYLKIENLRFTDLFEYEIIIEDSIRQDEIEIPPMVIQPFLENAIEHGLLKKETQGFLSLHIKQVNEFILECIIEDNGIGRMKSGIVPKRKGRESKGINLVKDRLLIINKNSKVEIIDLMDNGESLGTRVKLHIPYKRNI